MRIIDLLNKIANNEELPKKIKYLNDIWLYNEKMRDYYHECEKYREKVWLTLTICYLNDEVEIIEEPKKIEKIGNDYYHKSQCKINEIFQRKLNEIIDYINKGDNNE